MSFSRFGRKSFLRGMAHTLDLGATLGMPLATHGKGYSSDPDATALAQDWWAVGNDLHNAACRSDKVEPDSDGEK